MPDSAGWENRGRPSGNQTQPFPVICQVSNAYKASALTRVVGLEDRLPSIGRGIIGAGERSRTVPCLVGNDAAHRARPQLGQGGRIRTCGLRVPGSVV